MKNLKALRIYISVITVILTTLFYLIYSIPILAGTGLSLIPFISIKAEVSGGDIISYPFKLKLGDESQAMDIGIDVSGYSISLDGTVRALNAEQDTSQFSGRNFISVNEEKLHLEPGQTKEFIVNISIPSSVGDGGRYAVIFLHQIQPSTNGAAYTISAINIPILLNIKNSNIIHTGKILNVKSDITYSRPITIVTDLENTGNHHYKASNEVNIYDINGQLIDSIYLSTTNFSIIPASIIQFTATYIPKSDLPIGTYYIKSKVMLEDGTLLDEAEGSFEVKEPYVPPPAPASLTIKPDAASILKTEDGRISISFPVGAVLSQADLSLRSYPPEQLPSSPTGYTSGMTAFRVDGLNGLLAKPATLKVQYSSADLKKAAGGKAERLVLARWDEASKQWSIAKTKQDAQSMSLTAETNQFGLWAVLGGPPKAAVNWNILGAIIALVVIVFILGVFFTNRKRRRI